MGKVINFLKDGMQSLVNGLGIVGQDKAASTVYTLPLWTDDDLMTMYRGAWLPKKIVNIPAFDSMRRWRAWQASKADIELIENEEKRLMVKQKLLEVLIKARLFGGAALYISTGDFDVSMPLDPSKIGKGGIRFLTVMLKRNLKAGEYVRDISSELYGRPGWYELADNPGVKIHPSRLVIFKGEKVPDEELCQGMTAGWGDSVLQSTIDSIKNVDATAANLASMVFEAKLDIIKIPELSQQLSDPLTEELLLKRFNLASVLKGNNGMLLMDKEEEYEQKQLTFGQLPEVVQIFMLIMSGAADIPATRLYGQSPAGMSSTGESDLRNYYDRLQSGQTLEIDPAIAILNEAIIWSAIGRRDPSIDNNWNSLWQTTEKERADIGKTSADMINVLYSTSLLPPDALATAAVNMLTENGALPGLEQAVEDAGGLPDYEAEMEKERLAQQAAAAIAAPANNNSPARLAANDAAPRTLYIRRDVRNVADIRAWAKSQGIADVQDGLHVTIIHTRSPVDWIKVGEDFWSNSDNGDITIQPGGPRLMTQFGDATVLQFASSKLTWRHEDIKRMGAETDFEEYQPHVTITWDSKMDAQMLAKVEPYKGEIVLGPEIFEEVNDDWKAER